jgi:hypothetical protein
MESDWSLRLAVLVNFNSSRKNIIEYTITISCGLANGGSSVGANLCGDFSFSPLATSVVV